MNMSLFYKIINIAAGIAWIVLILFRNDPYITGVIIGWIVPTVLAATYSFFIYRSFASKEKGTMLTFEGVKTLFRNPNVMMAGWIHYLAFDLFIGAWELRDSQQHGINFLFIFPCLLLTIAFGPIGFLAYILLRSFTA
ncbi:MAG: DUF4281 domain-containing protein [Leptospira sp.]|nr:DUF4281 domain-containing protein [Leptospira sp.]